MPNIIRQNGFIYRGSHGSIVRSDECCCEVDEICTACIGTRPNAVRVDVINSIATADGLTYCNSFLDADVFEGSYFLDFLGSRKLDSFCNHEWSYDLDTPIKYCVHVGFGGNVFYHWFRQIRATMTYDEAADVTTLAINAYASSTSVDVPPANPFVGNELRWATTITGRISCASGNYSLPFVPGFAVPDIVESNADAILAW